MEEKSILGKIGGQQIGMLRKMLAIKTWKEILEQKFEVTVKT